MKLCFKFFLPPLPDTDGPPQLVPPHSVNEEFSASSVNGNYSFSNDPNGIENLLDEPYPVLPVDKSDFSFDASSKLNSTDNWLQMPSNNPSPSQNPMSVSENAGAPLNSSLKLMLSPSQYASSPYQSMNKQLTVVRGSLEMDQTSLNDSISNSISECVTAAGNVEKTSTTKSVKTDDIKPPEHIGSSEFRIPPSAGEKSGGNGGAGGGDDSGGDGKQSIPQDKTEDSTSHEISTSDSSLE